jgi:hypothetical protein
LHSEASKSSNFINNKQELRLKNINASFFVPNITFSFYNEAKLNNKLKNTLVKYIEGTQNLKSFLIPLVHFNILNNLEAAVIFIDIVDGKLIFPKHEKTIQMVKNNLLLDGNNVNIDKLYKKGNNIYAENISEHINEQANTKLSFYEQLRFLNKTLFDIIDKEKSNYADYKYLTPLFISRILSPVIYTLTGKYNFIKNKYSFINDKLPNNFSKIIYNYSWKDDKFARNKLFTNIYSVTLDTSAIRYFFDIDSYSENSRNLNYSSFYTNLNTIFFYNNSNLEYIDNIHITYKDLSSLPMYFYSIKTYTVFPILNTETLKIKVAGTKEPDVNESIYRLTKHSRVCKIKDNFYVINDDSKINLEVQDILTSD